jgi:DNA polymerase III delta subunit
VVFNALRNSTRFSYGELMGHLERVLAVDSAMKSTGQDPRLLLERLLIEICGQAGTKGEVTGNR